MTYEGWLEIYWAVFYVGRDFSFTMVAILFVLGIFRPIKKYAFAQPIIIDGDFIYSSFILRILWRASIRIGWVTEKEEEGISDVRRPYGAHIFGTATDIGITLVGGVIFSWLWPLIIIIVIGIFPIQAMHTHYSRKKEFIARLKGEPVEGTV